MKIHRDVARTFLLLTLPAFVLLATPGVKHTTVTKMKFHGLMGSMMKMAGGDKPHSTTNYVQGDVQRTDNFDDKGNPTNSTIIDLDREVYLTLDHKKKQYTEMTFAQWKEMMSKMMSRSSSPAKQGDEAQSDVKVNFDVKVDRTGEKRTIAGFNAEKVVLTMTATGEKAESPQEQGGKGAMTITSAMWLTNDVADNQELVAFNRKFVEKLGMDMSAGAQNMLAALQSNPQLANAMKKLAEESKKMQGFSVLTESKFEIVAEPGSGQTQQMSKEDQEKMAKLPKSFGGLLGKMVPKQSSGDASGSNVLYESTQETTEFTTASLGADLFKVPAGYKAAKHPMMKN